MEPVRVKLYGVFSMTRRGYLTQLAVAGFLLVALLVVWTYLPPPPSEQTGSLPAQSRTIWTLLSLLPWVLLVLALLFAVEAAVVLRRFARKAAEQKKTSPKL